MATTTSNFILINPKESKSHPRSQLLQIILN